MTYLTPALALVLAVMLTIDWQQTLKIARNPDKWRELNFILGQHPTPKKVNIYFAIVVALMLGFVFFPVAQAVDGWRAAVLVACIGVEGFIILMNKEHGL